MDTVKSLRLIAVLFTALLFSSTVSAAPTVEGNVISWPDDGWYQVQSQSDYSVQCEGVASCTVSPGTYIVINHSTGERWESIVVEEQNNTVTVSGQRIMWPDVGWYQVQSASDYTTQCQGTRHCDVVPGTYIVINHSTGTRWNSIVVSAAPEHDEIQIVDGVIYWPDDGWYQVQSAEKYDTICQGGRSCAVSPGTYHLINHSTGERWEGIEVPDGDVPVDPAENIPPGAVDNITVSLYSDTAAEIFWNAASDSDGTVVGYDIYRAGVLVTRVPGSSYFNNSLFPQTEYDIEVRAVDNTGASGEAVSISFTTMGTTEEIEIPELVEFPADCLRDTSADGHSYCYTGITRRLIAANSDGTPYWEFVLPSDSTSNEIRHLNVIVDQLIIIAELDPLADHSTFEISAFELGGAFKYTVPILRSVSDSYAINVEKDPLRVVIHEEQILIAGEYYAQDNAGSWQHRGSFVSRVDITSGATQASRLFPGQSLGSVVTISDDTLVLSLNGSVALLDATTLETKTVNSGLTFNNSNYREQRDWLMTLVTAVDYETIDGELNKMIQAIDSLTPAGTTLIDGIDYDVYNCPEGGTVAAFVEREPGSYGTNTTSIEYYIMVSCKLDSSVVNGGYTKNHFHTNEKYGTRSGTDINYVNFSVFLSNGDTYVVTSSDDESSTSSGYTGGNHTGTSARVIDAYTHITSDESLIIENGHKSSHGTSDYGSGYGDSSSGANRTSGTAFYTSINTGNSVNVTINPGFNHTYTSSTTISYPPYEESHESDEQRTGKLTATSSDGSRLIVDANNGQPDTVLFSISDGQTTTQFTEAW
ncbi:MAG: fibronectin type III domain-containing protein [Granulosicoccus sp.]